LDNNKDWPNMKIGEILIKKFNVKKEAIDAVLKEQKTIYKNQTKIGEILLKKGFPEKKFKEALILQFKGRKIGDILINIFDVPKSIIEEGMVKQTKKFHGSDSKLGSIITTDGLISKDTLHHALAIQNGLDFEIYNNIKQRIDYKLYKEEIIWKTFDEKTYLNLLYNIFNAQAIPIYWEKENDFDVLVLGITDPKNVHTKILIKQLSEKLKKKNIKIKIIMTSSKLYEDFLLKYKELTIKELEHFSKKIVDITPDTFLKYLMIYCILNDISDIHISPAANNSARIAVRSMGVVETLFYINFDDYNKLVSIIKTNADMNSNLFKIPQDGRIDGKTFLNDVKINVNRTNNTENDYNINENLLEYDFSEVSFRVSTYPTEPPVELETGTTFEKVVIRVLNLSAGLVELGELGLSKKIEEELNFAKNRTQGIILIVGPTGSGKSTTLYSLVSSINAIEKNIITFEDPVEMRQLFWAQGQRKILKENPDMNFDYLEAKKAILRQDPDVILMGEIRDSDSAKFATEAANTGHLVLSTIHANSSAGTFERFKKLGVNPLEIASSVLSVSSQRLIKKVCPNCHIKKPIDETTKQTLKRLEVEDKKIPKEIILADKNGCKYCNYKGFVGRTTIAEIIAVNSKIKKTIVDDKPDYEIRAQASEEGFPTLLEDGLEKMKNGEISIEELLSIV